MENKRFSFEGRVESKGRIQIPTSVRQLWEMEIGDWLHIEGYVVKKRNQICGKEEESAMRQQETDKILMEMRTMIETAMKDDSFDVHTLTEAYEDISDHFRSRDSTVQRLIDENAFDTAKAYIDFLKSRDAAIKVQKPRNKVSKPHVKKAEEKIPEVK